MTRVDNIRKKRTKHLNDISNTLLLLTTKLERKE